MRERCIIIGAEIELELRQSGARKVERLVGHAAVWDQLSLPIFGFRETVHRGAFEKSLQTGDQRAFWSHQPDQVLGRVSAGTLALQEDEIGLRVEITPPDTQIGRDAIETVRRGDVTQMSFGFDSSGGREVWRTDPELGEIRELLEVELIEVSPVSMPAYPETDIALREKLHAVELRREVLGLTPIFTEHYRDALKREQDDPAMAQKRRRLVELQQRTDRS